jgi:hydrogenase large subunit
MPTIIAAIDPVTRIEGHLKVEVTVDTVNGTQQVVDARAFGTLFRGFEKILENRDPRDAAIITSRICGVCPTSHAQAAVLALDEACGITAPTAGRLMQNLVHGACFLESHILHFYLLSLPDYVAGPGMAPWTPGWNVGNRIGQREASNFLNHYLAAIEKRRKAHEMGAIFGGRLPHTPAYIGGGFTAFATGAQKAAFGVILSDLRSFIANVYIPDAERLASLHSEYLTMGRGHANLLSYGVYRENNSGSEMLLHRGRMLKGSRSVLPVDTASISEHVTHSWYDQSTHALNPSGGDTVPQYPKSGAYSWLKAPRYNDLPYELGPLARMSVTGDYAGGVSVMDRHIARAREALKIANAMQRWLDELPTGTSGYTTCTVPLTGSGTGLTEAPRGALGHWVKISNQKISHYQIITPTCWNVSPKDGNGVRGALEEALMGIPVVNIDEPIEVLRVIHSFDPCLDCATHVMRPKDKSAVRIPSTCFVPALAMRNPQ